MEVHYSSKKHTWETPQETSGDIMKGVMCVSICLLIGWVWWLK